MKPCHVALALMLLPALLASVKAEEVAKPEAATPLSPTASQLCIFDRLPPAELKYQKLRPLKVGKGSYGGVRDVLPVLANQALALGADAIIDYNGAQRFGFWPWRFVRPVVSGVAVRWTNPSGASCEALGGTRVQTILDNNLEPRDRVASPVAEPASAPASAAL